MKTRFIQTNRRYKENLDIQPIFSKAGFAVSVTKNNNDHQIDNKSQALRLAINPDL